LLVYVTICLLFGFVKGRKYLKNYRSGKASEDYLFHSLDATLTLAGLAITSLAILIGLGLQNLERVSSIVLFFSISFVAFALSSNFMRFPRRFYGYIADVLVDTGVLAIGCGFLVFFEKELPSFYELSLTFVLFIIAFLVLSCFDLYRLYKLWSAS
jgi:hypothetical protein